MLPYSTTLNFGVLTSTETDHVMRIVTCIVPVFDNFTQNLALYNKNNGVLLSQAL